MISVRFKSSQFEQEMNNIFGYAEGFITGAQAAKTVMIENVGEEVLAELKNFIDVNARVNPMTLHHVYEWYQTGSPAARLFDIDYKVSNLGLSINSNFRQSITLREGSKIPFYNKAEIMENGVPVRIEPKNAEVLSFIENGERVFTRKPVNVIDPGGETVQGSYERVFDSFFNQYFTQSFIRRSGVLNSLKTTEEFRLNFGKAKRGGRSAGIEVGYKWMSQKGGL